MYQQTWCVAGLLEHASRGSQECCRRIQDTSVLRIPFMMGRSTMIHPLPVTRYDTFKTGKAFLAFPVLFYVWEFVTDDDPETTPIS